MRCLKVFSVVFLAALISSEACRRGRYEDPVYENALDDRVSEGAPRITFVYAGEWGKSGTGDGEFNYPEAIAVSADGNVYVADLLNRRVQYFTATGSFLGKWGRKGKGPAQFSDPIGIAVGSGGNVYVADRWNHRVQCFTPSGSFIREWGEKGSGPGQFDIPVGIAVSPDGRVYVADADNWRIQYFNSDGSYIGEWGGIDRFDDSWLDNPRNLRLPFSLGVAPNGDVYTLEMGKNVVKRYNSAGSFLGTWGEEGWGNGEFGNPSSVTVGPLGDVFVADVHRIQLFNAEGSFLTSWGSDGSGPGEFEFAGGVAVATNGFVYVADTLNYRVQYFRPLEEAEE